MFLQKTEITFVTVALQMHGGNAGRLTPLLSASNVGRCLFQSGAGCGTLRGAPPRPTGTEQGNSTSLRFLLSAAPSLCTTPSAPSGGLGPLWGPLVAPKGFFPPAAGARGRHRRGCPSLHFHGIRNGEPRRQRRPRPSQDDTEGSAAVSLPAAWGLRCFQGLIYGPT